MKYSLTLSLAIAILAGALKADAQGTQYRWWGTRMMPLPGATSRVQEAPAQPQARSTEAAEPVEEFESAEAVQPVEYVQTAQPAAPAVAKESKPRRVFGLPFTKRKTVEPAPRFDEGIPTLKKDGVYAVIASEGAKFYPVVGNQTAKKAEIHAAGALVTWQSTDRKWAWIKLKDGRRGCVVLKQLRLATKEESPKPPKPKPKVQKKPVAPKPVQPFLDDPLSSTIDPLAEPGKEAMPLELTPTEGAATKPSVPDVSPIESPSGEKPATPAPAESLNLEGDDLPLLGDPIKPE